MSDLHIILIDCVLHIMVCHIQVHLGRQLFHCYGCIHGCIHSWKTAMVVFMVVFIAMVVFQDAQMSATAKKVLLFAYMRGGSTILSQAFAQNPDVFFW